MEEKIDWELQDVASKINAQVVTTTAALNDAWRSELLTLNLPNEVLNRLWLETSFFGVFLLQKRFSAPLEENKSKFVNKAIRDAFLLVVPTCAFGDTEGKNADLKKYITSEYDRTLEMYKNYSGVDVKELFCNLIRDVFNTSKGSNVKFIDNTFGNRLKLKTAFFLSALGGNKEFLDKHGKEVYLPAKNLVAFANHAAQVFASIEERDINE